MPDDERTNKERLEAIRGPDRCEECGAIYLIMVGRIDHRPSCSQADAKTKLLAERLPNHPRVKELEGVVVDLITGHVLPNDEQIEKELRGGFIGSHPPGHDCSWCEDIRRKALRGELYGIPGASPKREEDIDP